MIIIRREILSSFKRSRIFQTIPLVLRHSSPVTIFSRWVSGSLYDILPVPSSSSIVASYHADRGEPGIKKRTLRYHNLEGLKYNMERALRAGCLETVISLFIDWKRHFVPDIQTYNIILKCALKIPDPKVAHATFRSILREGLAPNTDTFELLIRIYCDSKDVERAKQVFLATKEFNLKPTQNMVNLIDRECRKYAYFENHQDYLDLATSAGLRVADPAAEEQRIKEMSHALKTQDFDKLKRHWRYYQHGNMRVIDFANMVMAYVHMGEQGARYAVLLLNSWLDDKDTSMTLEENDLICETFTFLCRNFKSREPSQELAYDVFELGKKLFKHGMTFNYPAYRQYLNVITSLDVDEPRLVLSFMKKMESHDLLPQDQILVSAIQAIWGRSKSVTLVKYEIAKEVMNYVRNKGYFLSCKDYNSLLSGVSKLRDFTLVTHVLNEMNEYGVEPDSATYGFVIESCIVDFKAPRKSSPDQVYNLLLQIEAMMRRNKIEKTPLIYYRMAKALSVIGYIEETWEALVSIKVLDSSYIVPWRFEQLLYYFCMSSRLVKTVDHLQKAYDFVFKGAKELDIALTPRMIDLLLYASYVLQDPGQALSILDESFRLGVEPTTNGYSRLYHILATRPNRSLWLEIKSRLADKTLPLINRKSHDKAEEAFRQINDWVTLSQIRAFATEKKLLEENQEKTVTAEPVEPDIVPSKDGSFFNNVLDWFGSRT